MTPKQGNSVNTVKPGVGINLDALEQEGPGPFFATLGNRTYELVDLNDADFQTIIEARAAFAEGNVREGIELILEPEDRDAFFANRLSIRKLQALFDAYNAHYGIAPLA